MKIKIKILLVGVGVLYAVCLAPAVVSAQTLKASSNSPVCKGDDLHLHVFSGGIGYSWTGPDNFKSSKQNPVRDNVTAAMAGTYSVTVYLDAGPVQVRTTVFVGDPGKPGGIIGDRIVCNNNEEVFYYVDTVPGATSYEWTVPAHASILSGQGSAIIKANFKGAKSGKITVKAVNHCSSSAAQSVAVTVQTCTRMMQPDQSVVTESNTVAYPNPTTGVVTLKFNTTVAGNYSLEVFDMTGKLVMRVDANATEGVNLHTLDLGGLSKGIYTISLEMEGTDRQVIRVALQ